MRKAIWFLLLSLPLCALAQAPRPRPSVTVTAQGSFKSAPDTAIVFWQITGQNPDLQSAYSQAQSQAAQVRALLAAHGFTSAQAHWSGYQVQPEMDYKSHRVTGYLVSNDLRLEISDFTKIGPLLNDASGKGLTALRSVSFTLHDMAAAKAKAIADGYAKAKAEAEALAKAADMRLDGLETASVDTSGGGVVPVPRMLAMSAAEVAPAPVEQFSPQEITVTASINAVYRLGPGRG